MLELARGVFGRRPDPSARLLLAELIMFTGIAAVFPVAPLFVRQHGGNAAAVAIFIAGPMVANMAAQVPAGHLVDRIGRKPVLIGAQVSFALLSAGLFLDAGPLWLLGLFRAGQGLAGGAFVPALRAALADFAEPGRRGESYGRLQAVEMVGLLVGPAVGGAIALWTYSAIFLCSGLGAVLGIPTLLRLPKPKVHSPEEVEDSPRPTRWWFTRPVLVPSIALLAAGTLFAMYDVVWPQYLAARHIGTFTIGLSISLFAVPVIAFSPRVGLLADQPRRTQIVAVAFLIVSGAACLYPFLRSLPVILAVGTVEALGFTVIEPVLFTIISDATRPEVRGRAMGLGGFFQFGGGAIGAGLLGSLYGVAEGLPFWVGASICVLASATCLLWLPAVPRSTASEVLSQIKSSDLEARL